MTDETTTTTTSTTGTTAPPVVGTGHIVHTEFVSADPGATCTFLTEVFGWQFENYPSEQGDYWMFGDQTLGLGGAVRAKMEQEPAPYAAPYVGVEDINATVTAAQKAGATVMVPVTPVPNMGWFAWFQAPGGIIVSAWQNDATAPAPTPSQ